MKFTFTCKKISLNDSVKAYAEKKIGKLEKYFKEEPEATVTFAVEKKNRCIVEVMLRGANGTLFRAVCEDADGDMRGGTILPPLSTFRNRSFCRTPPHAVEACRGVHFRQNRQNRKFTN